MNALVQYNEKLPEHLRNPALFATAEDVAAGIGSGQPPYISIKGSKFRLVDANGEEEMVNALTVDVVILGANRHVSKIYYENEYDPNAGAVPPTCWSDNGQAPSSRAASPQHANCAGCPQNAWGSAVSKSSGKSIKACQDAKKLAVVLAADTSTVKGQLAGTAAAGGQLYQLRVPATSMRAVADLAKKVAAHGAPLLGMAVRVGFDPQASYPQLTFQPHQYLSREFFKDVVEPLSASPEVVEIVGGNDTPRGTPERHAEGTTGLDLGRTGGGGYPNGPHATIASTAFVSGPQVGNGSASPPAPAAASPASSPAATPTPTNGAGPAAAPRTRGRPKAAAAPPATPGPAAAAAPALFDDQGGQPAIQPAGPSHAGMDALLDDIFAKPAA